MKLVWDVPKPPLRSTPGSRLAAGRGRGGSSYEKRSRRPQFIRPSAGRSYRRGRTVRRVSPRARRGRLGGALFRPRPARNWVRSDGSGRRSGGRVNMAETSLEARRLTKTFGTRTAVDGVTFTAEPREIVGLLGPNGAGKTTTIRLLTAVLTPTSGEFSVAGVPSSQPNEIRRRVGVLPESAGYPAYQTGREYLTYFARLFGMSRSESSRVATRLLEQMGLQDRASSQLSRQPGHEAEAGDCPGHGERSGVVFPRRADSASTLPGNARCSAMCVTSPPIAAPPSFSAPHAHGGGGGLQQGLDPRRGSCPVSGTVAEITSAVAAPRFATCGCLAVSRRGSAGPRGLAGSDRCGVRGASGRLADQSIGRDGMTRCCGPGRRR
jgi:ABC-2 type transport system ATP-binding protein